MEFLRTRVARRVLSLFVLGSLFPIAVLVALSYRAVSSQLESQSEQRLADVTDIASQSLLDRFDFFHSWLRGVGVLGTVAVGRAGDPRSASFIDVVPGGVEGLALEEDGRVRTITGTVGQLPPLGAEDGGQLAAGRPLVKAAVGSDGASPRIFMALSTRPTDPDRGGGVVGTYYRGLAVGDDDPVGVYLDGPGSLYPGRGKPALPLQSRRGESPAGNCASRGEP